MSQLREAMRELFQSTSPSARSMLRHTLVIGVLAARTAASGDHGGHGHNGMSSGNNTMAMPSVLDGGFQMGPCALTATTRYSRRRPSRMPRRPLVRLTCTRSAAITCIWSTAIIPTR